MSSQGINDRSRFTFESLRKAERRNRRWHRRQFSTALDIIKQSQAVHLESLLAARRVMEAGVDEDFMFAYFGLMARSISHYQSLIALFEIGNYGDCFSLLRGIMTDFDTLRFLSLGPTLATEWRELAAYYRPGVRRKEKSQRWLELENKFSDASVRKALDEAGLSASAAGYGMLSESSHSTAWGLMFYGKPDYDQRGHFELVVVPEHDMIWATFTIGVAIALALQGVQVLLNRPSVIGSQATEVLQLNEHFQSLVRVVNTYEQDVVLPMLDILDEAWGGNEPFGKHR